MNSPAGESKRPRTKRPVLGSIFLLVGLVLLGYNWRWILSAFHGPVEMSSQEVGRIEDPSKLRNPWISFTYATPIETGIGLFEEGTQKPISRYVLASLDGRSWLVIEVPHEYKGSRFTGCLETWTVPLRTKSLAEIRSRFPQFPLLPYQMDAQYDYRGQCWALLGIVGFLIAGAVFFLVIGIASPAKSVGKSGAAPVGLHGPGGEASASQAEATLENVFEARQTKALTADQLYRVYAEDDQFYLIRIGGQQFGPMLAAHFGLLGGLIAAMLNRGNKSKDDIAKLAGQRPGDLLASHKLNFSFMNSDVLEASLDPPSAMAQHGPHLGRWTLVLKDGKKRTFQFATTEDMQRAERILTTALGPMLHVNVTWDADNERYRKR
jgi:hypothetical protein